MKGLKKKSRRTKNEILQGEAVDLEELKRWRRADCSKPFLLHVRGTRLCDPHARRPILAIGGTSFDFSYKKYTLTFSNSNYGMSNTVLKFVIDTDGFTSN